MRRRIVLLRAVNVGGATLPMARLKAIATDLGATDVSTYIASGNLLCTPPGKPADFDRSLEQAIEGEFGYFREAISRTPSELEQALAAHPFEVLQPRFSYVNFLLAKPTAAALEKARGYATGEDQWEVIGKDMHIRYAGGAGKMQMKGDSIGRALGVPGTARNLNTITKLIELSRGGAR